jgi:hypothetical protein
VSPIEGSGGQVGAIPPAAPTTWPGQWANIPQWQINILNALGQGGKLSGVNPKVLAGIDQAESSGSGGAINPEGYGGYFGLSPSTVYPGGNVVGQQAELGTDPSAFTRQAEVAGAEFSSLLASHQGNITAAEQAYQGGGTEGSSILQGLGLGGDTTFGSPTKAGGTAVGTGGTPASGATLTAAQSQAASSAQATLSTVGKVLAELDSFLNPQVSGGPLDIGNLVGASETASVVLTFVTRAFVSVIGLGTMAVGLYVFTRQTGVLGVVGVAQRQQRERRLSEQQQISSYAAETSRLREARQQATTFGGGGVTGVRVPPVFE